MPDELRVISPVRGARMSSPKPVLHSFVPQRQRAGLPRPLVCLAVQAARSHEHLARETEPGSTGPKSKEEPRDHDCGAQALGKERSDAVYVHA